jgi:hypothetical protein
VKNGVKNIQAAAYNGARTAFHFETTENQAKNRFAYATEMKLTYK